jgi:hypothetical protein
MKHKAQDKNLVPVVSTKKFIDILRGTGINVTYQELSDLIQQDQVIGNMVANIDKNQVKINLTGETDSDLDVPDPDEMSDEDDDIPDDLDLSTDGSQQGQQGANQQQQMTNNQPNVPSQINPVTDMARRAANRMN